MYNKDEEINPSKDKNKLDASSCHSGYFVVNNSSLFKYKAALKHAAEDFTHTSQLPCKGISPAMSSMILFIAETYIECEIAQHSDRPTAMAFTGYCGRIAGFVRWHG